MKVLITGGAGFIGSNFLHYMIEKYPNYQFVNLDLLTYAGNLKNVKDLENKVNYHFVQKDIRDRKAIEELFEKYHFEGVINFAAESHVDNSIRRPSAFIETNINGTFTLLDVARQYWMDGYSNFKREFGTSRFLHISTDEVYGSLDKSGYFTENSPYAPNSPYSASKAASDMLVRSYYHTYGMNVVTTNCSNNFGPMQHSEKLIPTIIMKALALKEIPIYGTGENVRDWLYVEDHCRAIDMVFHHGKKGETYLIGGNNERTNIEVANAVCEILDEELKNSLKLHGIESFKNLISFVHDRAGHDFRYAIDSSKIKNDLGWKTKTSFNDGLKKTVQYYLNNY